MSDSTGLAGAREMLAKVYQGCGRKQAVNFVGDVVTVPVSGCQSVEQALDVYLSLNNYPTQPYQGGDES